jgi:hypothetical protein
MTAGSPYGRKHPLAVGRIRIAVGIWLLVLTGLVFARGVSGWWAVLLLPAAGLHFYLAYRNLAYHNSHRDR